LDKEELVIFWKSSILGFRYRNFFEEYFNTVRYGTFAQFGSYIRQKMMGPTVRFYHFILSFYLSDPDPNQISCGRGLCSPSAIVLNVTTTLTNKSQWTLPKTFA